MLKIPIAVNETPRFSRWADSNWTRIEYAAFVDFIAAMPDAGTIIPGTGGVRKVRWTMPGRGKRGGARVIYYYHDDSIPLLLITAYAKSEAADLTQSQKRQMRLLTAKIKTSLRNV